MSRTIQLFCHIFMLTKNLLYSARSVTPWYSGRFTDMIDRPVFFDASVTLKEERISD